jgi:pantoate--beta-alanine ligase
MQLLTIMFALNLNKIPMPIFYGKAALIDYLKSIKTQNSTIGFVPTMGALHQGHLSLMQQSLKMTLLLLVFCKSNAV